MVTILLMMTSCRVPANAQLTPFSPTEHMDPVHTLFKGWKLFFQSIIDAFDKHNQQVDTKLVIITAPFTSAMGKDSIKYSQTAQGSTKQKATNDKVTENTRKFIEQWGQMTADPIVLADMDLLQRRTWIHLWDEWTNGSIIRRKILSEGKWIEDPLQRVENMQQHIRNYVPKSHPWVRIRLLYCITSSITGNTMFVVHGMKHCMIKGSEHSDGSCIRFELRRDTCQLVQKCMSPECHCSYSPMGASFDPILESIFFPAETQEKYNKMNKAIGGEENANGFQFSLSLCQQALELNPELSRTQPEREKKRSKHMGPLTKEEKKANRDRRKEFQMYYDRQSQPQTMTFSIIDHSFQSAESAFAEILGYGKRQREEENSKEEDHFKQKKRKLSVS
jgi:hypothetical protein